MPKFNEIAIVNREMKYVNDLCVDKSIDIGGNKKYSKKCEEFLQSEFLYQKVLLTNSCSSALEICALLLKSEATKKGIKEPTVIMPSYTFIATANAFAKFGFKIKFVDVKQDMNISETAAESAISESDLAIICVNYAGCSPDLLKLKKICENNDLYLIEDAAHSIGAKYNDDFQGGIGDLATISFQESKNISCGEGGALIINNKYFNNDAEIFRDKGTNRSKFLRGEVDKYSWVDIGGNYIISDMLAAFLYGQLEEYKKINAKRLLLWQRYIDNLQNLSERFFMLPKIPNFNSHNAHLFFIKLESSELRENLCNFLAQFGIKAFFHYLPLHKSPYGVKAGKFFGEDKNTSSGSNRLLRLPIYYNLELDEVDFICDKVSEFFTVAKQKIS